MITPETEQAIQTIIQKEEIQTQYDTCQTKGTNFLKFDMWENMFTTQQEGINQWETFEKNPKEYLERIKYDLNNTYKEYNAKELGVIFSNLPRTKSFQTPINEIRSEHENKGIIITGIIKRRSQVHTYISKITRECLSCGFQFHNTYTEEQNPKEMINCYKCKNRTKKIKEETTNIQYLDIEELEPNQHGRRDNISCVLKRDLCTPEILKDIELGKPVILCGKVERRLINKKNLHIKTLAVYGIEPLEETDSYDITPPEKTELEQARDKDDLVKWWIKEKKLYNQIEGYENIKEAIITSLIGTRSITNAGKTSRGVSHIFLCGDAGSAKSTFLKLTEAYALKSKYLTGAGATGVGLTGAVIRDELTGWTAEAGAMPLMHKGIVLADEIDKLPEDDENKLHEALEQMTVTLNKADISITLPAETTLISAGNPKKGNIDPHEDIFTQMGFKPTTISRMDLIFITRDDPDKEIDRLIGDKILENWEKKENQTEEKKTITLFKKYQKHAKTLNVKMPETIRKEIVDWYVDTRTKMRSAETKMKISSRAVDAIVRLTKSHARANLRTEATQSDLDWAKNIYFASLKSIAIDFVTGEIDMQKLEVGVGKAETKIIDLVYNIIVQNEKPIEYTEIKKLLNKDITDDQLQKILYDLHEKMKKIYEPRNGKWKAY